MALSKEDAPFQCCSPEMLLMSVTETDVYVGDGMENLCKVEALMKALDFFLKTVLLGSSKHANTGLPEN